MKQKIFYGVCFLVGSVSLVAHAQSTPSSLNLNITVVYPPDAAPTSLIATATSDSEIDLTWTNNASNADGVSIEEAQGTDSLFTPIDSVSSSVTSYARTGLLPNTNYFYRVDAFNKAGFSGYSNEASGTTSAAPSNGGGGNTGGGAGGGSSGGGGGGFYVPPSSNTTSVTISGSAYPASQIIIMEDGQIVVQTDAGPDGNFTVTINNLSPGSHIFSLYAEDDAGLRSTLFTFPVSITGGATTEISGVFISPTIDVDKQEVKRGDTLTIFGESAPDAVVTIQVNSDQTIFADTTSNHNGAYLYELDTAQLELGSHSAKSKATVNNLLSNESVVRAFTVGTENIVAQSESTTPPKGDMNGDGRVNLVDFSILAYWYGRQNPPLAYDLNGDGIIDLADFSIMAYYWTG